MLEKKPASSSEQSLERCVIEYAANPHADEPLLREAGFGQIVAKNGASAIRMRRFFAFSDEILCFCTMSPAKSASKDSSR